MAAVNFSYNPNSYQPLVGKNDPMEVFSAEINLLILSWLDVENLGRCVQVSRKWKVLADDKSLWKRVFFLKRRSFGIY